MSITLQFATSHWRHHRLSNRFLNGNRFLKWAVRTAAMLHATFFKNCGKENEIDLAI